MSDHEEGEEGDGEPQKKGFKSFTATDVQKIRLDKLMKNIDKPIEIPVRGSRDRKFPDAPDFVRNVMGSSAGAGSGEFHVYRHLRRKEFARQRFIEEQAKKEKLEDAYQSKLEANLTAAEQRTAKKRAKRLKKKQNKKLKGGQKKEVKKDDEDESDSDEDDEKPSEQQESNSNETVETPVEVASAST